MMARIVSPVLAASLLVALFACERSSGSAPNVSIALQTPWQQRDFSGQDFRHGLTDGIAMDPAGRFLVAAFSGQPINELAIVDLADNTCVVLRGADERVLLAQPAISVNGSEIAVVATPLARFGIGEIWIVERETGHAEVFGDPERSYRQPAFSPDGSRIAYFRDVAEATWRPGLMRPEYRSFLPYALFERNRSNAAEAQLTIQPFLSVCELAYDPNKEGLYFCALDPLRRDRLGGQREVWTLPQREGSGIERGRSSNYFAAWGEAPAQKVFPQPDARAARDMRFAGALSGGRALLTVVLEESENGRTGFAAVGAAADGQRSHILFSPLGLESAEGNLAASLDGSVIAGMRYVANSAGSGVRPILIIQDRGVMREINVAELDCPSELSIQPERRAERVTHTHGDATGHIHAPAIE